MRRRSTIGATQEICSERRPEVQFGVAVLWLEGCLVFAMCFKMAFFHQRFPSVSPRIITLREALLENTRRSATVTAVDSVEARESRRVETCRDMKCRC